MLWVVGPGEVSSAVAVGLATLLMLGCRAMHPPAGIDAFLVAGLGLPTNWIVNPVVIGAVLLAGYSRVCRGRTPFVALGRRWSWLQFAGGDGLEGAARYAGGIVKPRMRWPLAATSAFKKPRVSEVVRVRNTAAIGSFATRTAMP